MKLLLQNTIHGLVPLYNSDYEEKKKLKLGEVYEADIKRPRNYEFLKKFMALINIGVINSKMDLPFDVYRKIMIMRAGYFIAYQTDKGVLYEPESISFSSMDEAKFQEVYSRVLDKVIEDVGLDRESVEKQLINFM